MKIAIWGFGVYGKRMYHSITQFSTEPVEITCIYDRRYSLSNQANTDLTMNIRNPEQIPDDYKNGLFDQIMLCINNRKEQRALSDYLSSINIPEYHIGKIEDFYPLPIFEEMERPFEITQDHYEFHVLKNMFGALPNYSDNERIYIFDKDGRVMKGFWDAYEMEYEKEFVLDFPFHLNSDKPERIDLKGQYCVLAKIRSNNYWHFTYENMDCVWLLEEAGYTGKYIINNADYCREVMIIAGIQPERIIQIKELQRNVIYSFEQLFYVKLVDNSMYHSSFVLKRFADHIKKSLPIDPSLPKRIYVKRIGMRRLLNADKVMSDYNMTEIIPENYSVKEQMALFYNADIVFSVHGANSTNCLYMRENTIFIEAFSTRWENSCNLYTLDKNCVHYFPITSMDLFRENPDGILRDYTIPPTLMYMTMRTVFALYKTLRNQL